MTDAFFSDMDEEEFEEEFADFEKADENRVTDDELQEFLDAILEEEEQE